MIVQSEKFGSSLAQALKVYAVGKAGIKMLFPIVLFILPVLFVITLIINWLAQRFVARFRMSIG